MKRDEYSGVATGGRQAGNTQPSSRGNCRGLLATKEDEGTQLPNCNRRDLRRIVRDSQLDTKYIDFGVYGDELLYRTETYDPKKGMFSEDKSTIRKYGDTHKTAMRNARTLLDPAGAEDHDDLEGFLYADEAEDGT